MVLRTKAHLCLSRGVPWWDCTKIPVPSLDGRLRASGGTFWVTTHRILCVTHISRRLAFRWCQFQIPRAAARISGCPLATESVTAHHRRSLRPRRVFWVLWLFGTGGPVWGQAKCNEPKNQSTEEPKNRRTKEPKNQRTKGKRDHFDLKFPIWFFGSLVRKNVRSNVHGGDSLIRHLGPPSLHLPPGFPPNRRSRGHPDTFSRSPPCTPETAAGAH